MNPHLPTRKAGETPPVPQRLVGVYPPYPFWAWTVSRNPEAADDKGRWHRLTGPLPRGRDWPFYYWLPDQPETPTCDPGEAASPRTSRGRINGH